jgi:signal transduction histidine kinase
VPSGLVDANLAVIGFVRTGVETGALRARALRADREVEHERRLAQGEERARIARDLHDSVGRAINVIAVRAGAARMRYDQDRERPRARRQPDDDQSRTRADRHA